MRLIPSSKTILEPSRKSRRSLFNSKILVLTIAFIVTGSTWAISSPPGSSFDETYHIGSIWCAEGPEPGLCEIPVQDLAEEQIALTPFISNYCIYQGLPASCEKVSNSKELYPHRFWAGEKDYRNYFYRTMKLLTPIGARESIIAMRLLNVFVFGLVLFFSLLWLTDAMRQVLVIALVLSLVPQGIFLVSSINPSGWEFSGLAFYWAILLALIRNEYRGPRWALCGLLVASILLTTSRLEGPYFVAIASALILVFQFRKLPQTRLAIALSGSFALFAVAVLGPQLKDEVGNAFAAFGTSAGIDFNLYWLIHLVDIPALSFGQNFEDFGPLGGGDILVPSLVPIVQISAIVMVLYITNRKFSARVMIFQVLAFGFLYMTLIRLLALEMTYNAYWVQGRYILPLVPFIIGFSLYLSGQFDFSQHRHPIRLAVFLFSTSHAVTLMTIVVRFTNGTVLDTIPWPSRVFQLDTWRYISWLPSGVIWSVGTVAYSLFLWAAYRIITSEDKDPKVSLTLDVPTAA